jgi:hypothetical protein
MNAVSAGDQKPWETTLNERAAGLEIVLPKRSYVLPWSQFLSAEGDGDEIRLAFTTHDVLVRGRSLDRLLADLASQRVARLQHTARADRFAEGDGPSICQLLVVKIDSARDGK